MSDSGKQHTDDAFRESDNPYHLDLPDGRDFVSQRSLMPLDKFLEWLEEMRVMFPLSDWQRQQRAQRSCTEEFTL